MTKKKETELPKAVTTEEWEAEQRTQNPTPITHDVAGIPEAVKPETVKEAGRYIPENIYSATLTYLQSRPLGEVNNLYNLLQQLHKIQVDVLVSPPKNGN